MKPSRTHSEWLCKIMRAPVLGKVKGGVLGIVVIFGAAGVYMGWSLISDGGLRKGLEIQLEQPLFGLVIFGVLVALTVVFSRTIRELQAVMPTVWTGFQGGSPDWFASETVRAGCAFNERADHPEEPEATRIHLLGRVINAQEAERARIARELHDQTGQSLTSLILDLEAWETQWGNDSPNGSRCGKLRNLASQILDEIHDATVALRPRMLDDLGLFTAIQRQAEIFHNRFQIEVDFQVIGFAQEERFSPELETTLYRVVQEALTNVIRHARANSVSILLQRRGAVLLAVIEDNGKGFDAARWRGNCLHNQRLGLLGMEERVALLGGALKIESGRGQAGARLLIEIPLDKSPARNPIVRHGSK